MGQTIDMNLQTLQDERIDSYLRGQMSQEEEICFENDLHADAKLRSRARFIAKTIKALRMTQKEEDMMSLPPSDAFRLVAKNPNAKSEK